MKKLIDTRGVVHFDGPDNGLTLCGSPKSERDLLGDARPAMTETASRVDCPRCAAAYVAIKNMPYGAVVPDVLTDQVFAWAGVKRRRA